MDEEEGVLILGKRREAFKIIKDNSLERKTIIIHPEDLKELIGEE